MGGGTRAALTKPILKKPVNLKSTDEAIKIATIIFNEFELMQSCSVKGYIMHGDEPVLKGDLVLDYIREMDKKVNFDKVGRDKLRRKRVLLDDCIGGYVKHKIFKFKHEEIEGKPAVTIWRIQ